MRIATILAVLAGIPAVVFAQATPPAQEGGAATDVQPRTPSSMSLGELLKEAQKALEAKEYFTAKAYAEEILRRDEANVEALLIDAKVAEEERDVNRARERYLAVRAVQPNDFDANYGLGKIYVRKKIYRQAAYYLENAVAVAPPDRAADVLVQFAQAKRGMSKTSEALDAAARALGLDQENTEAIQLVVTLSTELGNFEQAIRAGQALVQITSKKAQESPGDVEAVQRVYMAYDSLREVYRRYFSRLFQTEPDGTVTDQIVPGNESDAAATIARIIDIELLQAELRMKLKHFELLPLAERAVQFDPTNIAAWMQYGLLLKSTSQFDAARQAFERILELKPDNAEALKQLASLGASGAASQPATEPAASAPAGAE
ncbi:MAG: tetratricopeptide repeat protein [Planctomycetota bacterium]|nr:MAG: tetratricopeptide repeat protein [Planctomycetota bacterium]